MRNKLKLLISLALPFLAGALGSFFTAPNIPTWYAGIEKPFFSPPNWIFAPVWTLLYFLMGVSLYLVWKKGFQEKGVKFAVYFFFIHLFFNAIWSVLFFGMQNILLGLIDIVIIWVMALVLIVLFWRIERWAGLLLVPYFLWVSFATLLNFYILILN